MARHMHKNVLAIFAQGRIQGEANYVMEGGFPFLKKVFFRPEGCSKKPQFIAMIETHVLWSVVVFGSIL